MLLFSRDEKLDKNDFIVFTGVCCRVDVKSVEF